MIGLALLPIWGALLIEVWQGSVKPRLIPRADLDRLAGDLIAQYRDRAGEVALRNEHRAWRDCDTFEQARWRRVRGIIGRRQGHERFNIGAGDMTTVDAMTVPRPATLHDVVAHACGRRSLKSN